MAMRKRSGDSLENPFPKIQRPEKKPATQTGRPSPSPSSDALALDLASSSDLILPSTLPFKRSQMEVRYPKAQSRGRHWKHLKQILQAENYHLLSPSEPTYANIEAPPSMYPSKKYCDITGFEAPYTDPRTKLRFADAEVFARVRSLPDEYVQGFLTLRSAQTILK